MDVLTALAMCRCLRDGGALLLWGGSAFLVVLAPDDLRRSLEPAWAPVRRGAPLALLVGLAAQLPVEAAELGRGWSDAFDPVLLRAMLAGTTIGTSWSVQAGAALLLLGTGLLARHRRTETTVVFSGLLLAASALTGHAAMRAGWLAAVQRGSVALHVLAAGLWLGALVPLLPTLRALSSPALHHAASVALRRFSWFGHGVVALVLATGVVNAGLILQGRFPDWASPYQDLLGLKAALVLVMAGLAVRNRYVNVPLFPHDPVQAARRIRRATLIAVTLGLAAVALVAVFGLLDPE